MDAGFLLGRYPVGEWSVIKKISNRRKINLTKNTGERIRKMKALKTLEEMTREELILEIKCMTEDAEQDTEANALKSRIGELLAFCTGQDMRELRAILGILERNIELQGEKYTNSTVDKHYTILCVNDMENPEYLRAVNEFCESMYRKDRKVNENE